jgi:hypothetical protein
MCLDQRDGVCSVTLRRDQPCRVVANRTGRGRARPCSDRLRRVGAAPTRRVGPGGTSHARTCRDKTNTTSRVGVSLDESSHAGTVETNWPSRAFVTMGLALISCDQRECRATTGQATTRTDASRPTRHERKVSASLASPRLDRHDQCALLGRASIRRAVSCPMCRDATCHDESGHDAANPRPTCLDMLGLDLRSQAKLSPTSPVVLSRGLIGPVTTNETRPAPLGGVGPRNDRHDAHATNEPCSVWRAGFCSDPFDETNETGWVMLGRDKPSSDQYDRPCLATPRWVVTRPTSYAVLRCRHAAPGPAMTGQDRMGTDETNVPSQDGTRQAKLRPTRFVMGAASHDETSRDQQALPRRAWTRRDKSSQDQRASSSCV